MMKDLLPEIRHDLRKWRAGDALDTERDDNIFEPNTVAFMAGRYPGLRIEPWDAESVIDQVTDRILADTRDSGDLTVLECFRKAEIQRRNAKAAEKRTENQLKTGRFGKDQVLMPSILDAEEALGRNAPDKAILDYIWQRGDITEKRLFNVQRARKALRAKGL